MKKHRLLILFALFLCGFSLWADFSYQETTKITGGSMLRMMRMVPGGGKALEPRTSTIYLKGNRMATIGPDTAHLVDLDKETITEVNFEKKTYSVVTFQEMKEMIEQMQQSLSQMRGNSGQPQQPQVNFKIDVKFTGQTKEISGLATREYLMTILMEAQAQQAGQPAAPNTMTSMETNLWMAAEVAGYNQILDFHKRMAQKAYSPEAMGALAMQVQGSSAAMKAMAEKMATLTGTPIVTVTRMKGSGMFGGQGGQGGAAPGERQESADRSAMPNIGGAAGAALGGLMRRRSQPKEQPAEQPAARSTAPASANSGDGVLMETMSEKSGFSTASIDGSKMDVPAGFKQVESEMKKSVERMRNRK